MGHKGEEGINDVVKPPTSHKNQIRGGKKNLKI